MMDWEGWVRYMHGALVKWAAEEREQSSRGPVDAYSKGFIDGLLVGSRMLDQILRHNEVMASAEAEIKRAVDHARNG